MIMPFSFLLVELLVLLAGGIPTRSVKMASESSSYTKVVATGLLFAIFCNPSSVRGNS